MRTAYVFLILFWPCEKIMPVWGNVFPIFPGCWSAYFPSVWHAYHLISSCNTPFFPGTTSPCAAVFPWYFYYPIVFLPPLWLKLKLNLPPPLVLDEKIFFDALTHQCVLRLLSKFNRHLLQSQLINISPCMLIYLSILAVLHNTFSLTWARNT